MKYYQLLSCLLLGLLLKQQAFSQSDTILTKDVKPFDKAFILKYPTGNNSIVKSASIFEIDRHGCLKTPKGCPTCLLKSLFRKKDSQSNSKKQMTPVSSKELKIVRQDSTGNVFIEVMPLEPAKEYFIVLNYSLGIKGMDDIFDNLDNGKISTADSLYNIYQSKTAKTYRTRYDNQCQCKDSFQFIIEDADYFKRFYIDTLQPIRKQIAKANADKKAWKDSIVICKKSAALDDSFLKDVLKYGQICTMCADSLWEYQRPDKSIASISNGILNIIKSGNLVLLGDAELKAVTSTLPGDVQIETRIQNIGNSILELNKFLNLIDYLQLKYGLTNYNVNRAEIKGFIDCLISNYKSYSLYKSRIDQLDKDILTLTKKMNAFADNHEGLFMAIAGSTSNTYTYSFETRSAFFIKADFGFLAYGNPWQNKSFWGVSPYLGFHVNFRQLNTDIPFKNILHKGLLGHLSFTSGLLLASVKEDNKRTGLIGDYSVFTGLGYAFGHGARINIGSVWYKKFDEDPLVTTKKVAAIPYAGISIDLRLKDIYNSFAKLF